MQNLTMRHAFFRSIIILAMVIYSLGLTPQQISQRCHCDITSSFCDFGCCCDTDCGTSISQSCFYAKSSFYCPKTDFFKSIKPSSPILKGCYYYNISNTVVGEKTLTNAQRAQLLAKNHQAVPVKVNLELFPKSSVDAGYKGYKISSILTIGGKSSFSFKNNQGNCLSTVGTSSFGFRFGQNTKISCICNNCGIPLLFSDIMGKTIPQFQNIASNTLTIPSVPDPSLTTLKINFIIGKYGSQKVNYIDRITYSFENNGSNLRTLYFNFINSDTILEQQNSASFFPQIPIDMFYPIHIMS